MPHLMNSDREKLAKLAEKGNEDAIFFLGQSRQQQLRNYYRGWKILADQGEADAVERLEAERERLRSNHVQRAAEIEAGCCDGDSEAMAKRDKHREGMRKRQQASRAKKNAAKPPAIRRNRRAVAPEVEEAADTTQNAEDDEATETEQCQAPDGGLMCSECPADDDESLPTGTNPKTLKQEADDDVIELLVTKVPPWKTRLGPAIHTFVMEEEIELKLKKNNAEIRQAALEAKKASLELERLYLKKPRMV
jgi:hypothetical protein